MTKKTIILSVGVVTLLLLVGYFLLGDASDEKNIPNEVTTLPEFTDTPDREVNQPLVRTLSAQNDLSFEVYNFIENGETIQDVVNTGRYILAGSAGYCISDGSCLVAYETDLFSISYTQSDDLFTLVILKEPISQSREAAESFLMSRLGVGEQEMCQLHYSFSTPYWVNEFYAGRELGFSFCPGSVSL